MEKKRVREGLVDWEGAIERADCLRVREEWVGGEGSVKEGGGKGKGRRT